MKTAHLEGADQSGVAQLVADVLKARGALVTEHTHSHVRFGGLRPEGFSFAKSGYVGVYHHVGEREVELRLRVEATVPSRLLWVTVVFDLVAALLLFAVDPPSSTWVTTGAFLYALLLAALLLYLGTWRSTWHAEAETFDAILQRLREPGATEGRVRTGEDVALAQVEEAIEGEIAERRLRADLAANPPPKPARWSFLARLLPKRGARAPAAPDRGADDAAAKRARADALRAEIERRRREGE